MTWYLWIIVVIISLYILGSIIGFIHDRKSMTEIWVTTLSGIVMHMIMIIIPFVELKVHIVRLYKKIKRWVNGRRRFLFRRSKK
jgi:hypothetical protein